MSLSQSRNLLVLSSRLIYETALSRRIDIKLKKAKLASQEVASVERKGHDSGPDSAVVTQLRGEILDLKRRLEQCDNDRTAATASEDKTDEDWASKCRDLEETLELMRGEFESMEDYWQVGRRVTAVLRILFHVLIVRSLQNTVIS